MKIWYVNSVGEPLDSLGEPGPAKGNLGRPPGMLGHALACSGMPGHAPAPSVPISVKIAGGTGAHYKPSHCRVRLEPQV